jgi:hypothetical protein
MKWALRISFNSKWRRRGKDGEMVCETHGNTCNICFHTYLKHWEICWGTPVTTCSFESRYSCLFLPEWLFLVRPPLLVEFQFISLHCGFLFTWKHHLQSVWCFQCDRLHVVPYGVSQKLMECIMKYVEFNFDSISIGRIIDKQHSNPIPKIKCIFHSIKKWNAVPNGRSLLNLFAACCKLNFS